MSTCLEVNKSTFYSGCSWQTSPAGIFHCSLDSLEVVLLRQEFCHFTSSSYQKIFTKSAVSDVSVSDTKRLHHEESGESAPNTVPWCSMAELWRVETQDMQQWFWMSKDAWRAMDMFHCPVQIEDPLESLLSLQSLYKSSGKHCSWHSLGEILAQQFCSPNLSYQWKPYEKRFNKNLEKSVDKSSHWVITFELLPMLLRSLVSRKGLSNRINSVWVDARPSCMSSPWWRLGCRTSDWSDRLITRGFETPSCSWMKVSYWSWHLEVLTSYNFIEFKSQNCDLCSVMKCVRAILSTATSGLRLRRPHGILR